MSHPIMALRAKGTQDVALIVDPEVTFFKTVYPRHTNFAMEDTEVTQSAGIVGYGQAVEFKLPRSGDLVTKLMAYIRVDAFPNVGFSPFAKDFGRILIDHVELVIGGYSIEKITGDFLHINDVLSKRAFESSVDNIPVNHGGSVEIDELGRIVDYCSGKNPQHLYIPLEFTFTAEPGLALPMIALQYHEVVIKVQFATADNLFTRYWWNLTAASTAPTTGDISTTVPLTDYKIVASTSFHTNALRLAEVKRILGLMDTGSTLYVTRRETSNLTNIMWAKDQTLNWILNEVDLAKTSAATGSGSNETTYPTAALTKGQAYVMTWTTSLPSSNSNNSKEQLTGFSVRWRSFNAGYTYEISVEYSQLNALGVNASTATITAPTTQTLNTINPRTGWIATPPAFQCKLLARYIYLDDFERRQFALNSHEYLITETQRIQQHVGGEEELSLDLKFNHPVKELLFFFKPASLSFVDSKYRSDAEFAYNGYWKFWNDNSAFGDGHLFTTCNLLLNSQTVFGEGRDPIYFSYALPSDFHTRVLRDSNVYVIPFAVDPESWKPTGSVNMSRLDSVKLNLKGLGTGGVPQGTIEVYARSFNVLRIQSGMGGKRFAS